MDSILKSLYVRLDSNADSLTANAIGQKNHGTVL